jgi:ribosomal protein S18 acetylase RimI-like enzyme
MASRLLLEMMTRVTPSDTQTRPIVRPATSVDLPRIGRLGALLVEEHHEFDSRRFLPTRQRTPADYGKFMSAQLEDPDIVVLVADDNGDVIGYTYAAVEGYDYMALRGPADVLHDIIVDPEYRRRGVGRLLLNATLAELESRGVPRVVLTTAERNEAAQRLFASVGFRRTMIEMTRELDSSGIEKQR